MYYPRKLTGTIEQYIENKEIIVLTGMRRVGKTTLLRHIFEKIPSKNKLYLDIENPLDQVVFEERDFNNILNNLERYRVSKSEKLYLFLDEIQAKPNLIPAIKYIYDHYNIKFFLTGSSSYYLKNLFSESLAGRKYIFELYPLDFEEFLIFKNQREFFFPSLEEKEKNKNLITFEKRKKLYDEYLFYGGFPEVVLADDIETKKNKINDVFKSYFEIDVKKMADFSKIDSFRNLIFLLTSRVGQKLDISKLSSEIGVSRITIYSYLSFLESTYFISLIKPYSKNTDREISGAKKVYFCDTGIINQLTNISEGSLFENSVFLNLKKYGKINYYQRRSGRGIDFILNKELGVEVKIKGLKQDLNKLLKLGTKLGLNKFFLISKEFSQEKHIIQMTDL